MTKSIENRLYLKKRLFRFDYKKGISMNEHLNNFNKIIADLKNLDVQIDDEDKTLLLLNSLPDTYDHLINTLLYGKKKIKYVDVSNALVNNEFRRKDKYANMDSTLEALTVRCRTNNRRYTRREKSCSKSRGRSSDRRRLAKDECVACRQKGNWAKDCPHKDKKDEKVNVARDGDNGEGSAFTVSSLGHSDEWILDFGCSYHMCPNKQWFSSFREFDGGVVLMGNDQDCRTKGIGTIRLKMHDGAIRILEDVRYVPDLTKNLMSVGVLDSKSCRVTVEGGFLKVVRGAFVAMKGTRKGNLYFLNGSTITGRVAISTSLEDDTSDPSRLWHMRLGHVGEKALQGLVKQGLLKGAKTGKLEFCEHSVLGKQTKIKFGTAIHCTKGILDYVHTDIWGPSKNASLGGKHYFVSFIDDFSRRV